MSQLNLHQLFPGLIGVSESMQSVFQRSGEIARVEVPVLIQGEPGTGKELVAKSLHQMSARADHAFIAVNCAGLTDSLLGSQLFGHRRGAFTGAMHDQEGFFEAAEGGTLFLDEIGDMPLSVQTTLLRALQEGEIIRLGGIPAQESQCPCDRRHQSEFTAFSQKGCVSIRFVVPDQGSLG